MTDPIDRGATADPLYMQTLGRGLEALGLLATGAVKLPELAQQMGINRSAAYRLVHTLTVHGFVTKDPGTGVLRLTPRLWELGIHAVGPESIRVAAGQMARTLAEKFGETVHLAIYHEGDVVYVDKADGWQPIGSYSRLGGRAPAYCVATGKILLAGQGEEEVDRVLGRPLAAHTDLTLTNPQELRAELKTVREQGYAVNRGEWRPGVGGLAVPLRDLSGQVTAGLGFSGPSERILAKRQELVEALLAGAAKIVQSLY